MKKVNLYVPEVKDLWFRQLVMSDPGSMSYNAGYDVSYAGYHYDTGCIDFPEENWETWHKEKIASGAIFYAYIQDSETKKFVGYLNYRKEGDKCMMGIVMHSKSQGQGYMRPAMKALIARAKQDGITTICDNVPKSREHALRVFFDLGFIITNEYMTTKFGKDDPCYDIELKVK